MQTDTAVRDDIEASLRWEPRVDVRDIGVAVKHGVATLTGSVAHFGERWDAEKIALRTRGVEGVANEIEVDSLNGAAPDDADIAEAAVNHLKWKYSVPRDKIKVLVKNGWLTLEGEVPWAYQRRDAGDAVRYLNGVRGVSNLVTVKVRATSGDVKNKIREAFKRTAILDADGITVSSVDGEVTLRGHVKSWEERREASRSAELAPGVRTVHNHMTVH